MKKIAVVGLGIIGGSICASLTKAGYNVDGSDIHAENVNLAMEKGYIKNEARDLSLYDVVFIAVPPRAALSILQNRSFKDNALVADICGIKSEIERAVYAQPRNYRYLGLHPMAGKETSGLNSASKDLFLRTNLIVTLCKQTQQSARSEMNEYIQAMGFGRVVECSAREHDEKIALTSQLAHLVSNAYVKSPQVKGCEGFTGGSFQDMTRIAGVDERMWTQLYFCNKRAILEELNGLIAHLTEYRDALNLQDEQKLSDALKEGRLIRETIKRKND